MIHQYCYTMWRLLTGLNYACTTNPLHKLQKSYRSEQLSSITHHSCIWMWSLLDVDKFKAHTVLCINTLSYCCQTVLNSSILVVLTATHLEEHNMQPKNFLNTRTIAANGMRHFVLHWSCIVGQLLTFHSVTYFHFRQLQFKQSSIYRALLLAVDSLTWHLCKSWPTNCIDTNLKCHYIEPSRPCRKT